jgi:hypothetical protein
MPPKTVKFTPEKPAREKQSHGLGITIFSAIILVVIVVTFIGAPVVSKVTEGNTANFGNYDGVPIEFVQGNTFSQQVEQLNRFYEQFNQGNNNVDLLRQMVWRQAFEQTALQIGLKHEAELAGIVVTDTAVDKALVTYDAYLKDGKFSEELYRNTSAADRFKYRQDMKTQLLVRQYALDHTQGALVSQATKDFAAGLGYPQRKFSFVTFTDADYPQNLVAEYAAKNKGLFRTIDVSRITVTSSEGDANKVRDEAVKGDKTFADLAKAYSKDGQAESGGALGVKRYFDLKADVAKAEDLDKIFALGKGAVSAVIKGDKTWTIYKVNAPGADADVTSADTLAVVRAYLGKNERGLIEDNLEAQAKAFSAEAAAPKADFAALAKKAGRVVGTTDWVALNFGNSDLFPSITAATKDATFQGLGSNDEFFKKAFKLAAGQVSAPILASPAVLVVKVDAVKEAPAAGDTPATSASVDSLVNTERNKELQQAILSSPKLKDQFQAEFNRLFQTK